MCMEDIRLGRELSPGIFQFVLPGAVWTRVLDADPSRTRIVFSNDGNATIGLLPEKGAGPIPSGFCISNPTNVLELTIEVWGRLITAPWFASTTGINPTLTVMAATLEKK